MYSFVTCCVPTIVIFTLLFSGITSFKPGYIDKNDEVIYGLQTDALLKRIVNPYGGVKLAEKELDIYGYDMHTKIEEFKKYVIKDLK